MQNLLEICMYSFWLEQSRIAQTSKEPASVASNQSVNYSYFG